MLTQRTQQALLEGWPGVFRHVILELMPVEVLGGAFDPAIGRPTKALYSMAGRLVVKAFMDWTEEEAVTAYRFHLDLHYARLFVEHDLAGQVMPG